MPEGLSEQDHARRDRVLSITEAVLLHFPLRGARYGLVGMAAVLLVVSAVQLLSLPGPPS